MEILLEDILTQQKLPPPHPIAMNKVKTAAAQEHIDKLLAKEA